MNENQLHYKVSVALCTHNGQAHFLDQLDSILAQSVSVHEIYIFDDASNPAFRKMIKEQIEKNNILFPNIAIYSKFNNPALGVAKNFEAAIQNCTGDLIFLADQDDTWVPNKVETICQFFQDNSDVSLVFTDAQLVDEMALPLKKTLFETLYISKSEINEVLTNRGIHTLARRNIVTGATVAMRRELRADAGAIPDGWIHDEWYAMVAAVRGQLGLISDSLINYRQHGANQIGVRSLSLKGKLGRLKVSRTQWNARLLRRAHSLESWVSTSGYSEDEVQSIVAREKVIHEIVRNQYPGSRLRRIIPVFKETKTGRYKSCGLGIQDIARDLIQPV